MSRSYLSRRCHQRTFTNRDDRRIRRYLCFKSIGLASWCPVQFSLFIENVHMSSKGANSTIPPPYSGYHSGGPMVYPATHSTQQSKGSMSFLELQWEMIWSFFSSAAIVYTTAQPTVSLGNIPFIGHDPVPLACPHCGKNVVTTVKYDPGAGSILMGGLICFLGGFLGCCFLPCCIPACQDATHRCPLCSSVVGHRKFLWKKPNRRSCIKKIRISVWWLLRKTFCFTLHFASFNPKSIFPFSSRSLFPRFIAKTSVKFLKKSASLKESERANVFFSSKLHRCFSIVNSFSSQKKSEGNRHSKVERPVKFPFSLERKKKERIDAEYERKCLHSNVFHIVHTVTRRKTLFWLTFILFFPVANYTDFSPYKKTLNFDALILAWSLVREEKTKYKFFTTSTVEYAFCETIV